MLQRYQDFFLGGGGVDFLFELVQIAYELGNYLLLAALLISKNHKLSLMERHVRLLDKIVLWLSMIHCLVR